MTFQKVLHWLVISSANPTGVSLTLKGVLMYAIPIIGTVTGLAHVNLGPDVLTPIAQALVTFTQDALQTVGVALTAYGLIRKLVLTVTGHNQIAQQIVSAA